jgi:Fur family ferric uptake transcriptional regulator
VSEGPAHQRWLALALHRLSRAGHRSGAARIAVVELLAREGACLLSAQDIVDRLREVSAGSSASVYRSLEILHGLGLVHRVEGRDGAARYEIADPECHHHHFVDEETGQVIPFEDAGLEDAIAAIAARLGVDVVSHDVVLRGRRTEPPP